MDADADGAASSRSGCAGTFGPGRAHEALRGHPMASRFDALLDGHLAPLIACLAREFGVAPKLLWTNAAASFAWTLQQCAARPEADGAALAEAEARLTAADAWPTARNPFAGALRPSPFVPLDQCSRRVCCLRYRLPGWADCGSFCPLNAPEKQPEPGTPQTRASDAGGSGRREA